MGAVLEKENSVESVVELPDAPNPWKTVSSREVYRNPWIRVREDQVICPGGKPGIYGVVESKAAAGVVAVDGEYLYLVGQYRYPTQKYSWEIIEGGADHGESPLEAAQRELKEEAGLTACHWEQLGPEVHLSNCFTTERGYLFIAWGLELGASAPDETESLEVRRVHRAEARAMLESGFIVDCLSIVGLYRYFDWEDRRVARGA
jgi:8-oxo-dGTP pyrophosphatase MutT (NUDIX family)